MHIHPLIPFISLLIGTLSGCSRIIVQDDSAKETELYGIIAHGTDTRTTLYVNKDSSIYLPVWESGDRIMVYGDSGKGSIFITEDNGTATARFKPDHQTEGNLEKSDYYTAVYPAAYCGETGELIFPEHFICRENDVNASTIPMISKGSGKSMYFKNLCGFIRVNLLSGGPEIIIDEIRAGAYNDLSGEIGKINANGGVQWLENSPAAHRLGNIVSLDCSIKGDQTAGTGETSFMFALPPGIYSGLVFQLKDRNCNYYIYSVHHDTYVERSLITDFFLYPELFSPRKSPVVFSGAEFHKIREMDYRLAGTPASIHIPRNSTGTLELKSYREEIYGDGSTYRIPVRWKTEFSIDENGPFFQEKPPFLESLVSERSGTSDSEMIAFFSNSLSGGCYMRISQLPFGQSSTFRVTVE